MAVSRVPPMFVLFVGLCAACSSGSGTASGAGGAGGAGGADGSSGSAGLGQGAWAGKTTDSKGSTLVACKPDDVCTICVAENCDAEAKSCYGDGWKQQSFGAACDEFLTCSCACDPNSSSCLQGCMGAPFDACRACTGVVTDCIEQKCNPVCCEFVPATWCPDAGSEAG